MPPFDDDCRDADFRRYLKRSRDAGALEDALANAPRESRPEQGQPAPAPANA